MKCPFCSAEDTQVIDSRVSEEGDSIRRRRRCQVCNKRFTTYETAELRMPQIVKTNGEREDFSTAEAAHRLPARAAQAPGHDRAGRRGHHAHRAEDARPGRARGRLAPPGRDGDGGAAQARQGGLHPLRLGLQELLGRRRFPRRDPAKCKRRNRASSRVAGIHRPAAATMHVLRRRPRLHGPRAGAHRARPRHLHAQSERGLRDREGRPRHRRGLARARGRGPCGGAGARGGRASRPRAPRPTSPSSPAATTAARRPAPTRWSPRAWPASSPRSRIRTRR